MKVFIQGSATPIDLTQKDYLAQGGEGVVYVKGKKAFKVYHDPTKMIPQGKFKELSAIQDPNVIRPQELLMDAKNGVIGYTMPFIDGGYPLCQLFPKSFRDREGIQPGTIADLVTKMQRSIDNVHRSGVLIVDLNEMNFLTTKKFDQVYFIDADSYQTSHYPATAIMDSIRDWTVSGNHSWTELTDWYSFAILSFQLFTGIHPFRGKYHGPKVEFKAKLATDPDDDTFAITRRRMLGNISIMHSDVGVPPSAYPLSVIPHAYQKWYEDVFIHGRRLPPPGKVVVTVTTFVNPTTVTIAGTHIDFTDMFAGWKPLGNITAFFPSTIMGAPPVIATDAGVHLDKQIIPVPMHHASVCGFSSKVGRAVVGVVLDGKLKLSNITDRANVAFDLTVKEASSYDGRIYVRTEDQIHEVVLTDIGSNVIASSKAVTNVMPLATQLFSGVAIQSMLGATYASLFVDTGKSHQIRIQQLDKHRVIDAKYDHGVLMVVAEHKGKYCRMVFRFDHDGTYDVRVVSDIAAGYVTNFVTLDSGVVICLDEDDRLELFSKAKASTMVKIIDDKALTGDMILCKHGGSVVALHGKDIFRMKMK
jgi:hypothetical protein